jgi:putative ABC transport system substrate-binding protein
VERFRPLKGYADALYVIPDPIANTNRIRINTLALGARLPTMLGTGDAAREAGLMSYGPNNVDLFRRAGEFLLIENRVLAWHYGYTQQRN